MPKPTGSSPTLAVIPNPVPLGSTSITVAGTGFKRNSIVLLDFSHERAPEVTTDDSGNFAYVHNYTYGIGNAAVNAFVQKNREWVKVATAYFTIA